MESLQQSKTRRTSSAVVVTVLLAAGAGHHALTGRSFRCRSCPPTSSVRPGEVATAHGERRTKHDHVRDTLTLLLNLSHDFRLSANDALNTVDWCCYLSRLILRRVRAIPAHVRSLQQRLATVETSSSCAHRQPARGKSMAVEMLMQYEMMGAFVMGHDGF
jgi:hypothetical protein